MSFNHYYPMNTLRSWSRIWAILLFVWGLILTQIPLLNLLSFEFAFACCLPISFLGAHSGFRSGKYLDQISASKPSITRVWLTGIRTSILLTIMPLIPILLNAIWVRNCNWLDGFFFYLLLPVATLVIAHGYGILIYKQTRLASGSTFSHKPIDSQKDLIEQALIEKTANSETRALLYFAFIFICALVWGIWGFISTPAVDVFSVFMGYYPGAIYDEELVIGFRLALSRLEDFLFIAVLLLIQNRWQLGHPINQSTQFTSRLKRVSTSLIHVFSQSKKSILVLALTHLWAWSVDLHRPATWVQYRLGGYAQSSHFHMYHPQSWSEKRVKSLLTELEFNYQELSVFFQQTPSQAFAVYFYQSPKHKKRLMGAGHTLIAKPWQRSIHIHAPYVGDRVITHELSHAFSADIAPQPHRLSMRYGLLPHMSLIEGLAVASTWTRGRGSGLLSRLSPHQWTAALRRLGIAPPLKALLQPSSFYSYNSSLAYTMCGSFVRFYRDEQGQDALNHLYARGGQGIELDEIINHWQNWLDTLTLDDLVINTAEALLKYPSIFSKVCAHEVAARRSQAYELENQGDLAEAFKLWQSIDEDVPGDQNSLLKRIHLSHLQGDDQQALSLAHQALNSDQEQNTLSYLVKLRLKEWLIDLDVPAQASPKPPTQNSPESLFPSNSFNTPYLKQKHEAYTELLKQSLNRSLWRRLAIKRYAYTATTSPELRSLLIKQLWSSSLSIEEKQILLEKAVSISPSSAEVHYLLARSYFNQEQYELAHEHFESALKSKLSHHSLKYESLRLQALGLFYRAQYKQASLAFTKLRTMLDLHILEGEKYSLKLWSDRARFFDQSRSF